jgi:hypothetical protein
VVQRAPACDACASSGEHAAVEVARARAEGGQPLASGVRSFMEAGYGADFSEVRVHTGPAATRSAASLAARAYTYGRDVVFGDGQYAPDSTAGRQLIAHELAHVVQQRGQAAAVPQARLGVSQPGDAGECEAEAAADRVMAGAPAPALGAAPPSVQRACGAALQASVPDCEPSDAGVGGWQFLFKVACDELLPGEEANIKKLRHGGKIYIHGFASEEGTRTFNDALSCHRAHRIAELARRVRPDCAIAGMYKHGASPKTAPGLVPDIHPRPFWRSVIIEQEQPGPQNTAVCGPDATDWLLAQIGVGKRNARVTNLRRKLDLAGIFAAAIGRGATPVDATDILEGAVATQVGRAWQGAGKPRHTPDANMQLQGPGSFGVLAFQAAVAAAATGDVNAMSALSELRDAALLWKALVGTGRPFDFKNDPSTMRNPRSTTCPDAGCSGTITLCAGAPGVNCYGTDVPGNLFYATVGRYVGFTEDALQLGSQWAQLTSTSSWDPVEDTQMISFGYGLPGSLDHAGFCAALQSVKGAFTRGKCLDCGEPTTASLIDPK